MKTKDKEIIEEFEKNGMVQALKKARDFHETQYNLLLKLFQDIALSQQREEFRKIIEGMKPKFEDKKVNINTVVKMKVTQALSDILKALDK